MTVKNHNISLISKGIFGVAIVAIAGTVGAIHFAAADTGNTTSGYGTTSQQATTASDSFASDIVSDNAAFADVLNQAQAQALSQLKNNDGASFDQFDASYNSDTEAYFNTLGTAFTQFQDQVASFANTATSKDQFIDEFNHAKADYLNSLDAAKNTFADQLGQMGDNANQVKDNFIDNYNSVRDAYSNALEQSKNTFADTISNL